MKVRIIFLLLLEESALDISFCFETSSFIHHISLDLQE